MVPGFTVPEITDTAIVALAVPQTSVAVTDTLPEDAAAPQFVVIELLPCPLIIDTPPGTTQL